MNQLIMKINNLLFSLLIVLLTFSCSNDDNINTTEPEATIKLKKITKTYANLTHSYEATYLDDGKIEAIFYNGTFINFIYNDQSLLAEYQGNNYTYNISGQLVKISRLQGFRTIEYDNSGRIIREITDYPEGTFFPQSPAINGEIIYTYNDFNQLVGLTITDHINNTIRKAEFNYNSQNQLTRSKRFESIDGVSFFLREQRDILYDSSKNPLRLMQKSIGVNSDITFTDALVDFNTNPEITHFHLDNNYRFSSMQYIPEYNIKNMSLKEYNIYGIETFNISQSLAYTLNNNEYPVAAELTATANDGTIFNMSITWEYLTY